MVAGRTQVNFVDADAVIAVSSTPYTIENSSNNERLIDVDCSSLDIAVTLPSVSISIGQRLAVKKNGAANSVTITPATGTIDGAGLLILYEDNALIVLISDGTNWHLVSPFNRSYVTPPIEVDHAAASPVTIGIAPANSIVTLESCRCTENESGCVLTIGDEDDADSHCPDAVMPILTTTPPIRCPLEPQYYAATNSLRVTITTAGSAGKWSVQFRITLGA